MNSKGTIIGAIGGTMIGAAILLFVTTMILNNLKAVADPDPGSATLGHGSLGHATDAANTTLATINATHAARNASWATFNTSTDTIGTILTVCVILLAVLGIVLIGSQMIAIIGGGFGG